MYQFTRDTVPDLGFATTGGPAVRDLELCLREEVNRAQQETWLKTIERLAENVTTGVSKAIWTVTSAALMTEDHPPLAELMDHSFSESDQGEDLGFWHLFGGVGRKLKPVALVPEGVPFTELQCHGLADLWASCQPEAVFGKGL
jgi:hypothetical protein